MVGEASSSTARAISSGSIRVMVSIPFCSGMAATKVSWSMPRFAASFAPNPSSPTIMGAALALE
ncbi:hypothetical protein [Pseudonocardia sp. MH-G8]|uniref:hypothetical protein n=1 Tax=Pseudonocardia sp. MH-G8 TaxID=1854588 RepID=UPI000BA0A126|nr:hypothetical protein [Pseudonocardia sp. MH-G8]OZM79082.1 hypothetical protein CFP66_27540 [Pseudonocardia sp. MH-G8]